MAGLTVFTGNRLETLLDRLAESLAADPAAPFEREVIVLPSQGMRRWLLLELARRHQVAALYHLPLPREWARELAERVLYGAWPADPRLAPPGAFDRPTLTWRLFALLGEALKPTAPPALALPAAYLARDADQRKRFQLAHGLATLFDEYQLLRGDLLSAWSQGEALFDEDDLEEQEMWQAWLWRKLLATAVDGQLPLATRFQRLIAALDAAPSAGEGWPRRFAVFGVDSLPPIFLRLVQALARHCDVTLYFASPTWHFWGDLVSDRELARLARRARHQAPMLEHVQRGNALLSALGQQSRDLFNALLALEDELPEGAFEWRDDAFEEVLDPARPTALATLQHDILHLIDRDQADAAPWPEGDASLRIHVCHSPLRELETLREELLAAFAALDDLRPDDVLVLLPDVDLYAPFIETVFGVEQEVELADGPRSIRLPFALADRHPADARHCVAALLDALALIGRRWTLGEVFGLLENPTVRRAAGLEESELPTLRAWLEAVRVRWAIDARQRQEDFDLPAFAENTWRQGLDRLVLGYATGALDEPLAGLAPEAGDTAGDPDLLGRCLAYLGNLFSTLRGLQTRRPAAAWAADIGRLLALLVAAEPDDQEEEALQRLRDLLRELRDLPARHGLAEELPLSVIREFLERRLAQGGGGAYLSGAITFCAYEALRGIPFQVVAMVGLDDASFPRRSRPRAFDLIAARPRAGDRSPRQDDRQLFLETLLATRRRLILSYVGASQRDAATSPPSVVLAELLDQVDRTFAGVDGRPARERVIRHQPLQAWSPRLFAPAAPASSSRSGLAAAQALVGERSPLPPFGLPIGIPSDAPRDLRLEDVAEALSDSARYFCRQVLGFGLAEAEAEAPDAELFGLGGLEAYALLEEIVARRLEAPGPLGAGDLAPLRARGVLPPAVLGAASLRALHRRVETLVGRLPAGPWRTASSFAQVIKARAGNATIEGSLLLRGQPGSATLLACRPARLRPRDSLRVWLHGLALAATPGAPPSLRVLLVGEDQAFELKMPPRPNERLEEIAALVATLHAEPLPFFERASYAYAEVVCRGLDPRARGAGAANALEAARGAFAGDAFAPGDAGSPYVRQVWRGRDPLAEDDPGHGAFTRWAKRIWQPLLAARREVAS